MEIAPLDGVEELYSTLSFQREDQIFFGDPVLDPRCEQGPDILENAPCGCADNNGIIKYKDGKAIPEYQTFGEDVNGIYSCGPPQGLVSKII